MGRIIMASKFSRMLVFPTFKYGLYPMWATSCGKLKHMWGILRFVRAFLSWDELQEFLFRVTIPIFKRETFFALICEDAMEIRS
jgi:hypothetical protein